MGLGAGQSVWVDEVTVRALGRLSREHQVSYGEMVKVLVMEEILREALREEADTAMIMIPSEVMDKIRARLGGDP